jgi:hypothetical protein
MRDHVAFYQNWVSPDPPMPTVNNPKPSVPPAFTPIHLSLFQHTMDPFVSCYLFHDAISFWHCTASNIIAGRQCGHDISDMSLSQRFSEDSDFLCFLCRVEWLITMLTDNSGNHDVSILTVNQPEMIWFVLKRGCSIRTLRHFGKSAKCLYNLDVHSWRIEEDELKFREGIGVTFIDRLVRAVRHPTANKPWQQTAPYSFLALKPQACSVWTYRGDFVPIPIYRSENWTLRKRIKND